jgi:polyisoprenoid-binding protein YceI
MFNLDSKGIESMLKKTLAALAIGTALLSAGQAMAADYTIDKEGQHAFVNFKISHLGYSFIYGSFKDWDGTFSFDAKNPEASKINVVLKTASVDTNHAERDKHIRTPDFLDAAKFPEAKFVSTSVKSTGPGTADVTGDLTLHGVTKPVVIATRFLGEGKDPWGGYRAGFEGTTTIKLKDFEIQKDLGPKTQELALDISFEGVQAK